MQVLLIVLAVLVFLAGVILDTGALLTLAWDFVRSHAWLLAAVAILAVAAWGGWRGLRRWRLRRAPPRRVGPARRGGRQPQRGGGNRRRSGPTRARS